MNYIEKVWYQHHRLAWLLLPFSFVFYCLSAFRRYLFKLGLKTSTKLNKPVIVVGNITVGGTGKTPMVLWLVETLKKQGLAPGIVSRGYKAQVTQFPYLIKAADEATQVGDEPKLLSQRAHCPVVISPDRAAGAQRLIEQGCNIIISDDGLQHYALQRDLELILIDGKRRLGNGFLLPAGPLREGRWRLNSTEFVIYNNDNSQDYSFTVVADEIRKVSALTQDVDKENTAFIACSGIGNPERFYQSLHEKKINIKAKKEFIDHHLFSPSDFAELDQEHIMMTEKDAVKCRHLNSGNMWYLPISAQLNDALIIALTQKIKELKQDYGL